MRGKNESGGGGDKMKEWDCRGVNERREWNREGGDKRVEQD